MAQATVPLRQTTSFQLKWPGIITALVIVGVVAAVLGFVVRDRQAPAINPDQAVADQIVNLFETGAANVTPDKLYTTGVVIHDRIGGTDQTGLVALKADADIKISAGFHLKNVTAPVRVGQVASWYMTYQFGTTGAPQTFLMVVRFSGDKIAEQWIYPIA